MFNLTDNIVMALSVTAEKPNVISDVTTAMPNLLSNITTGITNVMSNVTTVMPNMTSNITTEITNVVSNVTTVMPNMTSNITTGVTNVISNVTTAMANMTSNITTEITNVVSNVTTAMPKVTSNITTEITNVVSNVTTEIQNVISNIATVTPKMITNIIPKIPNMISNTRTDIPEVIEGISTQISNTMANVITNVPYMQSQVTLAFHNEIQNISNVSDVSTHNTNLITSILNDSYTTFYNETSTAILLTPPTTTDPIHYVVNRDLDTFVNIPILTVKTISLILIALSGAIGNGFIIYTIAKKNNLHRPPFYYLLSFCVSDFSRAVFCMPLVLLTVQQGSVWKYGSSACKLFAFANSFFIYSSGAALISISIDRYFSIVYSKIYKRRSRGLVNLIVVVVGWTVAFAMSFPPVVGIGSYVFIPEESQCTFHHRHYKTNDTLGFILVFALLVFVSVFLYLRVFAFLRKHRKMRPLEHPPARSSNWTFFGPGANGQALLNVMNGFGANPALNPLRMHGRPNFGRVVNLHTVKNEHLTRLFCIVTCVFFVLWFPYIVLAFWRMFKVGGDVEAAFVTVAAWLTYSQLAVCPGMYIMSRGPMRKHSRTLVDPNYKKEFLLEARNRK